MCFFVLICTPCSVELWPKRGVLVRLTRQRPDGCLTGLLTGPNAELWTRFGLVTQTGCQSFVWLTGPKRGQSSAFWSGQQTHQTPVSLCLINRIKTPRFDHSSTLQGVHIRTKNTFFCV
ncbi:hypothetical protein Hanom_Chr10g00906031 [Helianthus anomalus]